MVFKFILNIRTIFYKVKLSFDLCNFAFAKKLILPVEQLFSALFILEHDEKD